MRSLMLSVVAATGFVFAVPDSSLAQFGPPRPQFENIEVSAERAITFRIHAPDANVVKLASSDLPSVGQGIDMKKRDDGVWEASVEPVPAGAYRYSFNVDQLTVVDPKNPTTSESNMNASSLVTVTGSDAFDLKDVPHGAVSKVAYFSSSLQRARRMHVYTPPGYEKSTESYPVLYLLHGAFDCDNSWSTVGQAGQILDNLIAAGKAKPMIVVMPMGHTGPFSFGPGNDFQKQMDEFVTDFEQDVRPTVELRYRVIADREHRAICGLSMGGAHTLDIAFNNLGDYSSVGIFSSGIFGIERGESGPAWAEDHKVSLENAELRTGLKHLWFATGDEDFLLATTKGSVDFFKERGFDVTYKETAGGHTWLNWRDYLHEFAQMTF